jgi:hypothetical protein
MAVMTSKATSMPYSLISLLELLHNGERLNLRWVHPFNRLVDAIQYCDNGIKGDLDHSKNGCLSVPH